MPLDPAATVLWIVVTATPMHDAPNDFSWDKGDAAVCQHDAALVERDMRALGYAGFVECRRRREVPDG